MWYKKSFRRHLCDMHIDDWNPDFLSKFDADEYVDNLKTAKIQNAMIYLQSHVGLCHYPTKSGKMHNGFIGKEDAISKIVDRCHNEGITVTAYYSLVFNNWAHENHPDWRIVDKSGKSSFGRDGNADIEFADESRYTPSRYGQCCPNNPDYRKFIRAQIEEIAEYCTVDGMFYDMLYWPQICCCDYCRKRWEDEVGTEFTITEDWNDENWLSMMRKRREWIGEFAHWVTDLTKKIMPGVSVEHNVAYSALPMGITANAEEVIDACDYAGGDLYRDIYVQSFVCKFYKNITKNQPFEYMISRCAPNLSIHTQLKSKDVLSAQIFLTMAHHGASLVIDAIDPIGTMDSRVYNRFGEVFADTMVYEKYLEGEMVEDIGVYYSLKSRFGLDSNHTNYNGSVNTIRTLLCTNTPCGITGGFHDINNYKVLIASCLTEEDKYDNDRIIEYVRNGGNLYFSGAKNAELLKTFFGAKVSSQTLERVVYIAPNEKARDTFDYFNEKYPLIFFDRAPIAEGIDSKNVIATLTMPYTPQNIVKFASIHSNPPGVSTDIPAVAVTDFGKGRVVWSALPIECVDGYEYRLIFDRIINTFFDYKPSVISDAPNNVEIITFKTDDSLLLSTVALNTEYKATNIQPFDIRIKTDIEPKKVLLLPDETDVSFTYSDGNTSFKSDNLKLFNMYKIIY